MLCTLINFWKLLLRYLNGIPKDYGFHVLMYNPSDEKDKKGDWDAHHHEWYQWNPYKNRDNCEDSEVSFLLRMTKLFNGGVHRKRLIALPKIETSTNPSKASENILSIIASLTICWKSVLIWVMHNCLSYTEHY